MADHNEPIGRFVRAEDGAWRVALPLSFTPAPGDRVRVRRRDKAPQWISIGNDVAVLTATAERTYEVRRRHPDGKAPKVEVEAMPTDADDGDALTAALEAAAREALEREEQKQQYAPKPKAKDPAPMTTQAPATPGSVDAAIAALVQAMTPTATPLDEARVIELVIEHAPRADETKVDHVVTIKRPEGADVVLTGQHKQTATLLNMVSAGVATMLVGPAGSGKTSAARKVAEALGVPFYFTGAVVDRFALVGFRNANGEVVHTQYSQAIKQPCVFLFDEGDASAADALLAFNAAIDNRVADLPEGKVDVHPECRFIFSANTFGRGADRMYVGRAQLDAATIDRFAMLSWDYDRDLERKLGDSMPQWVKRVHQVRAAVETLKVRHVVSMRAVVQGIKLLNVGMTLAAVEDAVLWRGLDADARTKIERAVKGS